MYIVLLLDSLAFSGVGVSFLEFVRVACRVLVTAKSRDS